jgi:hypothetical protein
MPGSWQSSYYNWDICLDDNGITFLIQDSATGVMVYEGSISNPVTGAKLFNVTHLPVFARLHNVTAPASSASFLLTSLGVSAQDLSQPMDYATQASFSGFGMETVPTTFAQASNQASAAAPGTASLAAATPSYTTLGGQWQLAAVVGAETEFPLFGFTVPAPYSYILTGCDIDIVNTGATAGATGTFFQWFVVPDSTSGNITTAGIRRVSLGCQTIPGAALIGAQAARLSADYSAAPLVTSPGRLLLIGLKMPVGLATASQIFRGTITPKGYFLP